MAIVNLVDDQDVYNHSELAVKSGGQYYSTEFVHVYVKGDVAKNAIAKMQAVYIATGVYTPPSIVLATDQLVIVPVTDQFTYYVRVVQGGSYHEPEFIPCYRADDPMKRPVCAFRARFIAKKAQLDPIKSIHFNDDELMAYDMKYRVKNGGDYSPSDLVGVYFDGDVAKTVVACFLAGQIKYGFF